MLEQEHIHATRWVNVRRSQRVIMSVPVEVRVPAGDSGFFMEAGHTLVVNAHGALIKLSMKVEPGQTLLMKRTGSADEQECSVVHTDNHSNASEVGIIFAHPSPHFWGVDFPPSDWKALPD
jgi:hypothetical protein